MRGSGIRKRPDAFSYEEEERRWRERDTYKAQLLEITRTAPKFGPIGTWRFTQIDRRHRPSPIVREERMVVFEPDGSGLYKWHTHTDGCSVETRFEYKIDCDGVFSVRLIVPPGVGENIVTFCVEARRDNRGDLDLFVRFDSENPLPLETRAHWPFWGEFQRSTK